MTLKEKLFLINPIYWPAWLLIAILWLIVQLPDSWQIFTGKLIGKIVYQFGGKLKKITKKNISICFPELTISQQNKLAKKNFSSVGIGIIEAARAWWLPKKKLLPQFTINGIEHVEQAFTRGKGIILVGPHFTCLELVGRLLSLKYDFAIMYRPHKKALLAYIQENFRAKNYREAIPRHKIRQLIQALKNNMAVWYAYDIDGGKKSSVFAPFFGIQAASLTSVSRLADISDAAVIPIYFYRKENCFQYTIHLSPALKNFPSSNYQEDAALLNSILEKSIRAKPEQYLWQYKRFKTRPPGEHRIYD